MRRLILAFILSVVVVSALAPESLSQEQTVDARALLSAAFDGFEVTSWPVESSQVANTTGSKACCRCIHRGVKWVLKRAEKRVKKVCKTTKCPVIKRHCEFIHKFPKIGLGIIIAHVRPFSLAHAYCAGQGDCSSKKAGVSLNKSLSQAAQFGSWMLSDGQLSSALSSLQTQSLPLDDEVDNALKTAHTETIPTSPSSHDDQCRLCIHLTAHFVMHRALTHVKEYCEHAEGHSKQWCEWAAENREVAFGMLLVKVRPGEWACGFCIGKGVCGHDQSPPLEPIKLPSNINTP